MSSHALHCRRTTSSSRSSYSASSSSASSASAYSGPSTPTAATTYPTRACPSPAPPPYPLPPSYGSIPDFTRDGDAPCQPWAVARGLRAGSGAHLAFVSGLATGVGCTLGVLALLKTSLALLRWAVLLAGGWGAAPSSVAAAGECARTGLAQAAEVYARLGERGMLAGAGG